jgi:hypothetical protein
MGINHHEVIESLKVEHNRSMETSDLSQSSIQRNTIRDKTS